MYFIRINENFISMESSVEYLIDERLVCFLGFYLGYVTVVVQ